MVLPLASPAAPPGQGTLTCRIVPVAGMGSDDRDRLEDQAPVPGRIGLAASQGRSAGPS